MVETDPAQEPLRPGLYYRAKTDTLEVRLATGVPSSPTTGVLAQDLGGQVAVRLQRDDDGRLVAIVVQRASTSVPASLLKGRSDRVPPPGPLTREPADWFVPLFDGADLATSRYAVLLDGTNAPAVSAALSSSGRLTAFVVADAASELPEGITAPRVDG